MLQQLTLNRTDPISERTVRRLAEKNMKPYTPAVGPKLEREHRIVRLKCAREHVGWSENEYTSYIQAYFKENVTLRFEAHHIYGLEFRQTAAQSSYSLKTAPRLR